MLALGVNLAHILNLVNELIESKLNYERTYSVSIETSKLAPTGCSECSLSSMRISEDPCAFAVFHVKPPLLGIGRIPTMSSAHDS